MWLTVAKGVLLPVLLSKGPYALFPMHTICSSLLKFIVWAVCIFKELKTPLEFLRYGKITCF